MWTFFLEVLERAPITVVTTVLSFFVYNALERYWSRTK
jgi:hypothetical protein